MAFHGSKYLQVTFHRRLERGYAYQGDIPKCIQRKGISVYGEAQISDCHMMWLLLGFVKPRSVAPLSKKRWCLVRTIKQCGHASIFS